MNNLHEKITFFQENLPYRDIPYSKRNWGHDLHSLCSYQGKLKPSIAHWLVKLFSNSNDVVLDPTGGTGTIAFEACLQGRVGITNDLSPFAAVIGAAKVLPPSRKEVMEYFEQFKLSLHEIKLSDHDWIDAEFGLNARVKDYFHPETLEEILKAKKFFLHNTNWHPAENFIKANILHILHGNRPYALSRTSHPITPFSPKGDFIYRPLLEKLYERINRLLNIPLPSEFTNGIFYTDDFAELPNKLNNNVDVIITSPPFVGMRFDRPNWMRMWFCGWKAEDFHTKSLKFLERAQSKSWDIYNSYFSMCNDALKSNGLVVMHLGGSTKYNMVDELISRSTKHFETVSIITEDVSHTNNHGIKDKGITNSHKYLFLIKK